ncbi:MAG: hypothetical protein M3N08_07195, partial [Pseudomonadota bacterium]|nr:hypothetical protein [Pseudomonadota bacterium]
LFGVKIRNMWGTPFWNFAGLCALFYLRPVLAEKNLERFTLAALVVLALGVTSVSGFNLFSPYATHKAGRIYFPGAALGQQLSTAWEARFHQPLRYVIGDTWVGGNVAFYALDRPHLLIAGNYEISPWISPDDIKRYGAIIVWCRGSCTSQDVNDIPEWFWTEFSQAEQQGVLTLPQQTGAAVPPAKIGWAILAPGLTPLMRARE